MLRRFFIAALCLLFLPVCARAEEVPLEYAVFPAPAMQITQVSYEAYSHSRLNAMDLIPHADVTAPFTGIVTWIDHTWGYVVLQSLHPVLYPDGTLDYMTMTFMHDIDISDLQIGQIIEQDTPFYQAGGKGPQGPETYRAHVHIACYRGKAQALSDYGNGDYYPFRAMFLDLNRTTEVLNYGVMDPALRTDYATPGDWRDRWTTLTGDIPRLYMTELPDAPEYIALRNTDVLPRPDAFEPVASLAEAEAVTVLARVRADDEPETSWYIIEQPVPQEWYVTNQIRRVGFVKAEDLAPAE